jgi:hypothetical protein
MADASSKTAAGAGKGRRGRSAGNLDVADEGQQPGSKRAKHKQEAQAVHDALVDTASSATIAAARVGAQERIRAAALDSEGDSQHKVLLRIRAPPNIRVVAGVRVVAPTALVVS